MITPKHTPGPWRWIIAGELKSDEPKLVGENNAPVCDFGNNESYYPTQGNGPNTADERLIAAAPDLLAACQRAFHVFENDTPRKCEAMGLIEAAITKALGESL